MKAMTRALLRARPNTKPEELTSAQKLCRRLGLNEMTYWDNPSYAAAADAVYRKGEERKNKQKAKEEFEKENPESKAKDCLPNWWKSQTN